MTNIPLLERRLDDPKFPKIMLILWVSFTFDADIYISTSGRCTNQLATISIRN